MTIVALENKTTTNCTIIEIEKNKLGHLRPLFSILSFSKTTASPLTQLLTNLF